MKSINLSINKRTLPTVILSISLLLSIFTYNTLKASSLSPTQVNAIITLLQSFGADQNTINKVRSSLTGQPYSGGTYNDSSRINNNACITFKYDLWIGRTDRETNGEVSKLQRFLIKEGVYPEAIVSGYYGILTARAVMRWQHQHGLTFTNLRSGVGVKTRAKMRELCYGNGGNMAGITGPTTIKVGEQGVWHLSLKNRNANKPGAVYVDYGIVTDVAQPLAKVAMGFDQILPVPVGVSDIELRHTYNSNSLHNGTPSDAGSGLIGSNKHTIRVHYYEFNNFVSDPVVELKRRISERWQKPIRSYQYDVMVVPYTRY